MPVKTTAAKPYHNRPDLVAALAQELRKPSDKSGPGIPDIQEEVQIFGGRIHVRVLWDKWEGVPQPERGPIVLDAYREERGEREMLNISLIFAFTAAEWARFQTANRQVEES
jgi:hypothetical protein